MRKKWNFLSFAMGADLFGSYRITKHFGFYGNLGLYYLPTGTSKFLLAKIISMF